MTLEHADLRRAAGSTNKIDDATRRFSELLRALETEHRNQKQELGAEVERLEERLRLQSEGIDLDSVRCSVPTERFDFNAVKDDAPPPSQKEQSQEEQEALPEVLSPKSGTSRLSVNFHAPTNEREEEPLGELENLNRDRDRMASQKSSVSPVKAAFSSHEVWRIHALRKRGSSAGIWRELTNHATRTMSASGHRRISLSHMRRSSSILLTRARMLKMLLQIRPGVISPNGTYRMCWDILGLIFILFDIVVIPLQAFTLPASPFTTCMDWLTLIYWTSDVYHGFMTGHYHEGQKVMSLRKIARRYVTSWFLLDILVIVPDWILMLGFDAKFLSGMAVGRAMRLGKTLRVLRLVRIVKLKNIVDSVLECVNSEYAFTVIKLIKLMCFILLLNHLIACLWYLVGDISVLDGDIGGLNWIEEFQSGVHDIPTLYFASLHWSLTQFTPASMNVCAQNIYERVFSIAVLFFAMMAFTSVVGSVTASMTSLGNLKSGQLKELWQLRRYLRQNFITKELQYRIEKFLEYRNMQDQATVQPASVVALSRLSEPLKNELTFATVLNWLKGHFLFKYISSEMPTLMHRLSRTAILVKSLAVGDIVFSTGEESLQMFFMQGSLLLGYRHMSTRELDRELCAREWLSEAALWVPWRHLGDCQAIAMGELLTVSGSAFAKETSCKIVQQEFCAQYASLFIRMLNDMQSHKLSDVMCLGETDKDIPRKITDEASQVVSEIPPDLEE